MRAGTGARAVGEGKLPPSPGNKSGGRRGPRLVAQASRSRTVPPSRYPAGFPPALSPQRAIHAVYMDSRAPGARAGTSGAGRGGGAGQVRVRAGAEGSARRRRDTPPRARTRNTERRPPAPRRFTRAGSRAVTCGGRARP